MSLEEPGRLMANSVSPDEYLRAIVDRATKELPKRIACLESKLDVASEEAQRIGQEVATALTQMHEAKSGIAKLLSMLSAVIDAMSETRAKRPSKQEQVVREHLTRIYVEVAPAGDERRAEFQGEIARLERIRREAAGGELSVRTESPTAEVSAEAGGSAKVPAAAD